MGLLFANNAGTTLASAITDLSSSLILTSGSLFPTYGVGDYSYVTLTDDVTYEIVKVDNRATDVLTVASSGRGKDGTAAASWPIGTKVEIRIPRITASELLSYAGTATTSETNAAASASAASASAALAATYVPLDWEGAWLTATSYQVNDAVKEAGSSYVCLVAHTSGTFATDLAALKWDTIAEKGAAGAGAGDVVGPASATNNSLARYDGTTGKLLKDGAVIGTDVQAYDAQLADIAGLTPTDNGVVIGNGTNFVVESGATLKTSLGLTIGTDVQAYDADTAKLDVAQTFIISQRGTLTTDNDGSFDQNVTNKFKCTPTGAVALTFTNHTSGQGGTVVFINGSSYAITAAATTYIAAADLVKLSATGTYLIGYEDDGTNAYCSVSTKLTSAGV